MDKGEGDYAEMGLRFCTLFQFYLDGSHDLTGWHLQGIGQAKQRFQRGFAYPSFDGTEMGAPDIRQSTDHFLRETFLFTERL